MSDATRAGLRVLAAALLLGVLGDALLRAMPWGINAPLWVAALVAAALAVKPWDRRGLWLLGVAVLFTAGLAWRDAAPLAAMNGAAALVALGLALPRSMEEKGLQRAGFFEYFVDLVVGYVNLIPGLVPVAAGDIRWSGVPRGGRSEAALAVGRGLLLALPILLLFGALLTAADAVFNDIISRLFDWDFETIWSHLFAFALTAWLAGGYLRAMVVRPIPLFGAPAPPVPPSNGQAAGQAPWTSGLPSMRPEENAGSSPTPAPPATATMQLPTPGTAPERAAPKPYVIEGATVLASLDLLFLAFFIVQVRYLFGGGAYFAATSGLTYAEYARRGFFELVTVAGLCLPLLLGAHSAMRSDKPAHRRLFAALSGVMVLLLFGIIASALKRMDMYVDAYGLTELRVYTTACMLWLGVVFGWFLATVAAGRREPFAFGAMLAAAASLLALNIVNPDALIVKVNTSRPDAAARLDATYLASLSADAIPPLLERMPSLPAEAQDQVAMAMKWREVPNGDWRTWNSGRARARAALRRNHAAIDTRASEVLRRQEEAEKRAVEHSRRERGTSTKTARPFDPFEGTAPAPPANPR